MDVTLPRPERGYTTLTVADDSPAGFRDLADAYTMFKRSYKEGEAAKRGIFNLGEKLALALCEKAAIETMTGTVRFDSTGRHVGRERTDKGSIFTGRMRLTIGEWEELWCAVRMLIPGVPALLQWRAHPRPEARPRVRGHSRNSRGGRRGRGGDAVRDGHPGGRDRRPLAC